MPEPLITIHYGMTNVYFTPQQNVSIHGNHKIKRKKRMTERHQNATYVCQKHPSIAYNEVSRNPGSDGEVMITAT